GRRIGHVVEAAVVLDPRVRAVLRSRAARGHRDDRVGDLRSTDGAYALSAGHSTRAHHAGGDKCTDETEYDHDAYPGHAASPPNTRQPKRIEANRRRPLSAAE